MSEQKIYLIIAIFVIIFAISQFKKSLAPVQLDSPDAPAVPMERQSDGMR